MSAVGDKMCDVFIYGAGHVGRPLLSCPPPGPSDFLVDTDEDRFPEVIRKV